MEDFFVSKEDIKQQVREWAFDFVGESFEFREYQLESIVDVIDNIINNKNHTQIIEAPTGSGKSLINIIAAGVVAKYYKKTSYILCSDLYLWKQYEDFINAHSAIKKEFGIIKGQTGNYTCDVNHEDMRNADCRMGGISWASMFNPTSANELGYNCAIRCKYVKARKKALASNVVIMTYQLYHFMVNVVSKSMPDAKGIFRQRDIIFCDECHNIPSIVKNNFQPEIRPHFIDFFHTIYKYNDCRQLDLFGLDEVDNEIDFVNKHYTWTQIEEWFNKIFTVVSNDNASQPEDKHAIKSYWELLYAFASTVEQIESELSHKKQVMHATFSKEDVKNYKACSWFRNTYCFWNDFNTCVAETGWDYIVKEVNEDRNLGNQKVVTYSNSKEDFLSYYFLLSTARDRVLLSATIGGEDAFEENIGTHYIEEDQSFGENEVIDFKVIPSTFNFEKSPILFLNRYKMSYANKEQSLKSLKPMIYKICKQFDKQRGMIQTGSYANAKEIYDNAPPELQQRLLLYNSSKEKTSAITLHQMMQDSILIGPTLVEGIDLPGDECRFIIIMKVPYPVITDKYVKKKMQLFPLWYNSTTSNTIIQGIGRGNRFKDDYCTTYILDACFLALYNATKEQYAKELQQRIKIYA